MTNTDPSARAETKETVVNALVKQTKGRFFAVEFIKKNGERRKMIARTGVTRHLKGGERSYDPEPVGNFIVFDTVAKGYRTINMSTVVSMTVNGERINFE